MSTAMPPQTGGYSGGEKVDRPVTVPGAIVLDATLSWKAKGLLVALMHDAANGVRLSTTRLIQIGSCGRDSVLAGLNELEAAGRIVRRQERGPGSSFARIQIILINPETGVADTGVADTGHPATGSPHPVYGATEGHTPRSLQ
jgi:hypothetical protein